MCDDHAVITTEVIKTDINYWTHVIEAMKKEEKKQSEMLVEYVIVGIRMKFHQGIAMWVQE